MSAYDIIIKPVLSENYDNIPKRYTFIVDKRKPTSNQKAIKGYL